MGATATAIRFDLSGGLKWFSERQSHISSEGWVRFEHVVKQWRSSVGAATIDDGGSNDRLQRAANPGPT